VRGSDDPGSGRTRPLLVALTAAVSICACSRSAPPERDVALVPAQAPYQWRLPPGLPVPRIPADNPMSEAKVRLGRWLFSDTRLSGNRTFSCASCHQPAHAFTDARAGALGSTGQTHVRNTMSLANVAYNASYGWADASVRTLEAQMAIPMFNEHPVELGLKGRDLEVAGRFASSQADVAQFREAFPGESQPVTLANIVKAIASFERTLVSAGSALDRYLYRDDRRALSPEARRGMQLYFSDRLACGRCHGGFNLSGPTDHEGADRVEPTFHNTALYNVDGRGGYPATDRGLFDKTGAPGDMGRFRAPTLRNVALTAPYMHDGSVPTLEAAIAHYASRGVASPLRSPLLKGFTLSPREAADLVAFLNALTDLEFITSASLAAPAPLKGRPTPSSAPRAE
jgi:cytochrome c peroxidase